MAAFSTLEAAENVREQEVIKEVLPKLPDWADFLVPQGISPEKRSGWKVPAGHAGGGRPSMWKTIAQLVRGKVLKGPADARRSAARGHPQKNINGS